MKQSLFCLLMLLVCFELLHSTQSRALEFYYFTSDMVRLNEQSMAYQLSPFAGTNLSITGINSVENRLSFNRESKRTRFELALSKEYHFSRHSLESGYIALYDNSDIDISTSPYTNKTGYYGYALELMPLDSLQLFGQSRYYFRNEQDRFAINKVKQSDGLQYRNGIHYGSNSPIYRYSFESSYENKALDRERFNIFANSFNMAYYSYIGDFWANAVYRKRNDDLYKLETDSLGILAYSKYDKLAQEYAEAQADFTTSLAYNMGLRLSERFYQQKNRRQSEVVNDNADYQNTLSLNLFGNIIEDIAYDTTLKYDYGIKDYSYTTNSNVTDTKHVDTRISWEYTPGDSLIAGYQIEMKRSNFPDESNPRDKDLRKQVSRLGIVHYIIPRLRFSSWLLGSVTDEINVNALYSANNKNIKMLNFSPELKILIGDRVLLSQYYSIRADYTGYQYASEQYRDNLYRQLSFRYNLLFDDYPFIARSGYPIWLALPYRKPDMKAFSTELSFQYEQNEFGYKEAQYYAVSKNTKLSAQVNLKYDIEDVYVFVQPKYSWGTWKEYSAILGVVGNFGRDSNLEISINPLGETYKKLDWRLSTNLNVRF